MKATDPAPIYLLTLGTSYELLLL